MSISPNVPSPQDSYHYENTGTPRWITVLFGVLFVALAATAFLGYTSETRLSQDLAKAQDQNKTLAAELAQARSRAESIRKEQQATAQKFNSQLTEVQKNSEEKIGAVATDLGGAK